MKRNTLIEAIGYADDKYLDIAENFGAGTRTSRHRRKSVFRRIPAAAIAATLIVLCTAGVFALSLFSPPDGDDFTMDACYNGGGTVTVVIENLSEKDLKLAEEIKLMKYYANEEIPASGEVQFSSTLVRAKETASIRIDLSEAYDVDALEQPLTDDWYYLLLTNNNFLFGYDWQCYVAFSESAPLIPAYPEPVIALPATEHSGVLQGLESYFENYVVLPEARNEKVWRYYADVRELLTEQKEKGIRIVSPANPLLFVGDPSPNITLDARVPLERQYQLVLENHFVLDGYNIPVGASDLEDCMVLSTCVPQRKADISTPDGTAIPLIYIFQFAKSDISSPDDRAFIRGRLLSFSELEKYKVYDDDRYVCYEVTDLFYTDLEEHIRILTEDRSDIYMDEGIMTRLRNVYDYLKDGSTLGSLFYYNEEP